jgi:DHA1 family bicyclomycin/chloramphenicol resistance-like MFS transporter
VELTPTGRNQRFGTPFMVGFLILLMMFVIFSTDMYAPALPSMTGEFNTSETLVNMTVLLFFACMIVGMLVLGPMSDRAGRRPILLFGTALYVAASLGCVFAWSIWALIVFRIIQAIACGGLMASNLAVVKDTFVGQSMVTVLMITQAISVIGPIAAPVFGAWLLEWFSWRASFVVLAALGAAAFVCSLVFRESLAPENRSQGSLASSLSGLGKVARNGRFMVFLLVCVGFTALPFNLYLTTSSFIYEDYFGLSPQAYSYFFGASAGLAVLGLFLYRIVSRRVALRRITTTLILGVGVCGAGMLAIGHLSPWLFFACMLGFQMIGSMVRPYSANVLLMIHQGDTGAASSMLNVAMQGLSSLAMLPAILMGGDYLTSLAILILIGFTISLTLWIGLLRSKAKIPLIKD